jgi:uncharacterized repeat protein (TIGR02543 family)
LPTDPTYDPAWAAGVTFDGWNTAAAGTGTVFTKDTPVTASIPVYAQWSFTAGEAKTEGATLVQTAPVITATPGQAQGSFTGSISETDGSATYSGGGITFAFPEGYADYDFVEVEWTFTNSGTQAPNNMIFKRGATSTDYIGVDGAGSQYFQPAAGTISGTQTRKFPIISGVSSIGFQIYWDTVTPFDLNVKITKLIFTKGVTHTITFNTAGGESIEPMTITEGKPFTLPTPVKTGSTFLGWQDASGNTITSSSLITTDLVLTAQWKDPTPVTDFTVDFNSVTFIPMGGGTAEVINGGAGYKFTYGDGSYQANQVKFAITLPNDAVLGDYASVAATIEGTTAGSDAGKTRYKHVFLLAGSPLPDSWSTNPEDGAYQVSPKLSDNNLTQGKQTLTFNIVAGLGLSGSVEFSFYTPADAAGTQPRTYEVTNVTFLSKVEPATEALEINLATAGDNGTVFKDVTIAGEGDYQGISFNLTDYFGAGKKSIRSYKQITIVTKCYSDTAGTTLLTTGNQLFTATLFEPWVDYSASSFPGYGTPGRLQANNAGVNSHDAGYTYNISTSKNPEGIRFERNNGGAGQAGEPLKSIEIISIKFLP